MTLVLHRRLATGSDGWIERGYQVKYSHRIEDLGPQNRYEVYESSTETEVQKLIEKHNDNALEALCDVLGNFDYFDKDSVLDLNLIESLVKRCDNKLNQLSELGLPPIAYTCVVADKPKIFKKLFDMMIKCGAEPLFESDDGETLFHYLISDGHVDSLKYFCNKCGKPNGIKDLVNKVNLDSNGRTPLFGVAGKDSLQMFNFLLESGADVNVCDNDGKTILHSLAYMGKLDHIKRLHTHGKFTLWKSHTHSRTEWCRRRKMGGLNALHYALKRRGNRKIIRYLLNVKKMDKFVLAINEKDTAGYTALDYAVMRRVNEGPKFWRFDIKDFKTLVRRGAKPGPSTHFATLIEKGGRDSEFEDRVPHNGYDYDTCQYLKAYLRSHDPERLRRSSRSRERRRKRKKQAARTN